MKAKKFLLGRGSVSALARCSLVLVLALLVGGCPASKQELPSGGTNSTKVVIRGANTFGEELAPRLISAFKKDQPTAEFDVETKATLYGFGALLGGKADIAAASRPPLKEELELAKMRGVEMNEYVVGSYTVAVIVNSGNSLTNLTKDQVRDIFTGTIKNWKEVGGPDAAISLYIRDPIAGTHFGFKEMALGNTAYSIEAKLFTDYGGIVRSVGADPGGIGYAGLDSAKDTGVKAVSIGGIEPSVNTVHKGDYPYSRVVKLHTAKGRESDQTKAFLKFVQSERGKTIVAQSGFTP
jgi:phosphate transport system substrate-binding protein